MLPLAPAEGLTGIRDRIVGIPASAG